MCGIVGLFLKDERLRPELGGLLGSMLGVMTDRGPDSAGFAVYGEPTPGMIKLTLRGPAGTDFAAATRALEGHLGCEITLTERDTHAVLALPAAF